MIEALVNCQNPLALNQLVDCSKSPQHAPIIAAKLPVRLQGDSELLWQLYLNLLNTPGTGPCVYQQTQFYDLCGRRSTIDSDVCRLLRTDDIRIDIAQHCNLIGLLCDKFLRETDANAIWDILAVVYKWSSLGYHSEFEVLIPRLMLLLRSHSPLARLAAFLSLTPFAATCPQKVDITIMLEAAVVYLVDGSEILHDICMKLIDDNWAAVETMFGESSQF
jgi:hypothetical protein